MKIARVEWVAAYTVAMGRRNGALRQIAVNGRVFRWKADWHYVEGQRIVRLRVWGGNKTSQILHAHLVATFRKFIAAVERGEIPRGMYVLDDSYIMPREVRFLIEYGLTHGWDPDAARAPFCLTAADPSPSEDLMLVDIH